MKNLYLALYFLLACVYMVAICISDPLSNSAAKEVYSFTHADKKFEHHAKIILLTIDGARWQEIFQSSDPILSHKEKISSKTLFPNLYTIGNNGMIVGNTSLFEVSNKTTVSLPGYLELVRGEVVNDCQRNDCEPFMLPTILDKFNKPVVISSWEQIYFIPDRNKTAISSGLYNRSNWVLSDIKSADFMPGHPKYRLDKYTQRVALDYLNQNSPDFLWISLGDADDYAHMGDYSKYLESLQSADRFIGYLMRVINLSEYTVIVVPDHGRGKNWRNHGGDPQASRIWAFMSGAKIPALGAVLYKTTRHLVDIYSTILDICEIEKSPRSLLNIDN